VKTNNDLYRKGFMKGWPRYGKKNMILHSKTKRKLNQLSHFKFKQRLQSKARTKSHCEVYIVTEDFTTKTCTNCGSLNDVKSEKK